MRFDFYVILHNKTTLCRSLARNEVTRQMTPWSKMPEECFEMFSTMNSCGGRSWAKKLILYHILLVVVDVGKKWLFWQRTYVKLKQTDRKADRANIYEKRKTVWKIKLACFDIKIISLEMKFILQKRSLHGTRQRRVPLILFEFWILSCIDYIFTK